MNKRLMPALLPCNSKSFLFFLFFLFTSVFSYAQTVTGKVVDGDNKPVSGATITIKGGKKAVVTNDAGRFDIAAAGTDVLVVSSVGFVSLDIPVKGRSAIDINLVTDARNLNEVVVTALGITKQARGLGYSATNVKSDELTVNRTSNPLNALEGKVAGVNVSSLGTGPGGTSKIRIRGQSSISGQNNPLIVINGVPFDNTNFNDNTNGVTGGGSYSDGGDGLSSINPDDIESMTILKGAPAAALYGSRAKDGVIMITTKTKGKTKGIGVTLNTNFTDDAPLDYTDYQYEYGQGEQGLRPTAANPTSGQWSFGERFQPGMTQILYNNLSLPYVPQRHILTDFYRHGQNFSNTVTLETSNEKGGIHLSVNNTDNLGIVPNNSFNRKSLNLGFSYNLNEKLSFGGNVNYSHEYNKNPPNVGNQDNTIPTALMGMANSMPLSVLEANKYNAQGNEYIYSRFMNRTNPYWTLAEQFHNIRRDRIFGNTFAKYNFLPWLFGQVRFGQDFWTRDEDINNFPTGQASRASTLAGFVNGIYTQESRRYRETNLDFLLSATKEFGDFSVTLTGGGNELRKRRDINNVQVTDFVIRGLYTVQNGRAKNPTYDLFQSGVNSLYSSGEVSWKRTLYLSATTRNDWFSTLSKENRSILYPSVSGAYVFSETLKRIPWLTFGKVRLGYAEVGSDNDVGAYSGQLFYAINGNLINNPSGTAVPVGTSGTTVPNPNLKPSRTAETELGLELKLFNNRLSFDFATYRKITNDQIVTVQISDASGFVNTRINSGKSRDLGFEGLMSFSVFKTKSFSWDFTANTAYNKTKVLSIITNTPGERITLGTHPFNGEVRDVVGLEIGQIAGYGYARDSKGQILYQSNGVPQKSNDIMLFGSALPKWTGGFLNTFNYKGISLSILIDYKLGNKMLSGTNFNAIREGLHKMTLQGRDSGFIGVNVVGAGGAVTRVKTPVQTYWEHVRTATIIEPVIYNGGFWKLRQITLGYDFTKFVPAKWPIKGVKVDFVANNVFLLKKWVDNIDPESMGYGSDNFVGLESPGLLTTRSLGLNVNIKF